MAEQKFTPRAENVLRLAQETALELGHGYVGCEHILLGLLREAIIRETLQLLDEKAGIAQEMAHILLQMEKAYINTALEALSADSVKKLQGGAIATARAVSAGGEHEV